jgi:DNA modification methylase
VTRHRVHCQPTGPPVRLGRLAFAGSGTTIIASEQTGRRCVAMEIDPRYVQVAVERWEAFTGQSAERIDG